MTDTGYRIPFTLLKVTDKASLCKAIREYHTIIKILPEINQFGEGLEVLGVMTMIRKNPKLLSLYFIDEVNRPIDKGMCILICSKYFKAFLHCQHFSKNF